MVTFFSTFMLAAALFITAQAQASPKDQWQIKVQVEQTVYRTMKRSSYKLVKFTEKAVLPLCKTAYNFMEASAENRRERCLIAKADTGTGDLQATWIVAQRNESVSKCTHHIAVDKINAEVSAEVSGLAETVHAKCS